MRKTGTSLAGLLMVTAAAWGWQDQVPPPTVGIDRAEAFAAYLMIVQSTETSLAAAQSEKSFSAAKEKDLLLITGLDSAEFAKLAGPVRQHQQRLDGVLSRTAQHVKASPKGSVDNSAELKALSMERAKVLEAAMVEVYATASAASRKAIDSFLAAPYRRPVK